MPETLPTEHGAAPDAQVRLLAESERRRQTAEALAALATDLSSVPSPETVLGRVLDYVEQLVEADIPYLHVVEPTPGARPLTFLRGTRGERLARFSPAEGKGVAGLVLASGRPFRTASYVGDPRISHEFDDAIREEGVGPALAVPVHVQGRPVGVLGALRRSPRPFDDADERVLVQLAAQAAVALGNVWLYREVVRAKQQWETAVDRLHEGLALVDPEQRVLRINRALAGLLGREPGALAGRTLAEVFPFYAAPEGQARVARALAGTGPTVETIDGGPAGRVYEETLAPVQDGAGSRSGLVVLLRDVTEARRRESQLLQSEKLAALGGMLAGIAHEINNPLTAVLGFAQLLEAEVGDPAQRDDLKKLASEATRAARLVQRLLTFARQHPPEHRLADLNALVTAAAELLRASCRGDGVSVETDLDPKLPETWADPHQLEQVLINLLTNARQAIVATGRGGRIRIVTRGETGWLALTVADEGPGIPPNVLPRIFDPFFTTKAPGSGTGLGLSVCHSIVGGHDGAIWVDSQPGYGTTVHVRIPVVLPPPRASSS